MFDSVVRESGRAVLRARFYGPTNTLGARIRVARFDPPSAGRDRNAVTVGWDYALGLTDNYVSAVREYVTRAGWLGEWSVATCEGGAVGVYVGPVAL